MKQLAYILSAFLLISFVSCGDKSSDVTEDVEMVELKGYEEINLSKWGFNMSVMVPNAEENGEPQIELTQMGSVQIIVGAGFGIEIMYGEGDIELLKTDLKEDLVFSSEILKEEENALVYTQDIPDSGVKTQHHFFYKAQLGENIYEVRDLMDGEYGEGMIEKMLAAAKTIKAVETANKEAV
ncbi:MAG: hypothetical protein J5I47_02005 [Vicingus serpentipes]|nr:hypothetical protein [Vicingus serpentipes]